jgi:hypothetical protein
MIVCALEQDNSMEYIYFWSLMPRCRTLARSRQLSHLRPILVCFPRGPVNSGASVAASEGRRLSILRRAESSRGEIRVLACRRSTVFRYNEDRCGTVTSTPLTACPIG